MKVCKEIIGDYIVMDAEYFRQGMQHGDAIERNREVGQDIQDKIAEHYNSLPSRPDYDGYLTRAEANSWWLGKSGESLFVFTGNFYQIIQ